MKQYFPKFVFKYQLSLNTINAKADNNEYRDYFVDTIIYLPITIILDDLSRPPIWLNLKFFRSSLPSKIVSQLQLQLLAQLSATTLYS